MEAKEVATFLSVRKPGPIICNHGGIKIPNKIKVKFYNVLSILVYLFCGYSHVQELTCASQLSLSIMWAPGIELRFPGLEDFPTP